MTGSAGTRAHVGASSGPNPADTRAPATVVDPIEREGLARGFGAELIAYREALELSQAELAARSGVSERWIRELESGRARPSDGICRRLAVGLMRDSSRLVQAAVDVRLQRLAGASLRYWARQRPPRESTARVYEQAAAIMNAQPEPPAVGVDAWLEDFNAVWFGGGQSSRRS